MTELTTLIPAYKKEWLGELFHSLRAQTWRGFRVILSDDSPGAAITRHIREGHFDAALAGIDLTVVRGPGNARRNHEQLMRLWGGRTPLVHLLMDDDLLAPEFYRRHVEAHRAAAAAGEPLGVSVSRRWLSAADGKPALDLPLPAFVTATPARDVRVAPQTLIDTTVAVCENWLGELSHMVFSAAGAAHYPLPPAQGLSAYALLDIGWVLETSRHLPVLYLNEHLGVFRQHPQQTTHALATPGGRIAHLAWVTYALWCWKAGRLADRTAVQAIGIATQRCLRAYPDDPVLGEFFDLLQHQGTSLERLHDMYAAWWQRLLASHPGTRPAAGAGASHGSAAVQGDSSARPGPHDAPTAPADLLSPA